MGVLLDEEGWKPLTAGIAGPLLASLVGRLALGALGDFLKMLPGIGTVAGGSLNVLWPPHLPDYSEKLRLRG
jgi:hypothetical protein